jgi:hypothetical protein
MHEADAFGNCWLRGVTGFVGSLRMKRFAFSDVTKSKSASGSFPSLVVMRVSYRFKCEKEAKKMSEMLSG